MVSPAALAVDETAERGGAGVPQRGESPRALGAGNGEGMARQDA